MSSAANTIILEDDDDDVRVFSPHSYSQWSSLQVSNSGPLHIPVLDDEDLELRLGPAGNMGAIPGAELVARPIASRRMRPEGVRLSISNSRDPFYYGPMVDLTIVNEGSHSMTERNRFLPPPEAPRELKLTCAICMDTMEEETSTICGHIFCRKCIMEAIKKQKKCPTCRKRLVSSQTHRIYLS